MKETLQTLLEENGGTITESVINELLEDSEGIIEDLLYFQEYGVEGGLVKCIEFERDCIKFFNKYYKEIEEMRKEAQDMGQDVSILPGYSNKMFFASWAFKTRALDLYMLLVMEDL